MITATDLFDSSSFNMLTRAETDALRDFPCMEMSRAGIQPEQTPITPATAERIAAAFTQAIAEHTPGTAS